MVAQYFECLIVVVNGEKIWLLVRGDKPEAGQETDLRPEFVGSSNWGFGRFRMTKPLGGQAANGFCVRSMRWVDNIDPFVFVWLIEPIKRRTDAVLIGCESQYDDPIWLTEEPMIWAKCTVFEHSDRNVWFLIILNLWANSKLHSPGAIRLVGPEVGQGERHWVTQFGTRKRFTLQRPIRIADRTKMLELPLKKLPNQEIGGNFGAKKYIRIWMSIWINFWVRLSGQPLSQDLKSKWKCCHTSPRYEPAKLLEESGPSAFGRNSKAKIRSGFDVLGIR